VAAGTARRSNFADPGVERRVKPCVSEAPSVSEGAPALMPDRSSKCHINSSEPKPPQHHDDAVATPLTNARRSALIWSGLVVAMPCGKPGYTFSVAFFKIFADMRPAAPIGTI
jgi:hypothetical protein